MKLFDVCGLGNALVDVLLDVSEAEFAALGLERGTMRLVDVAEQRALLSRFESRDLALVSGGSVANSVIAVAQLGGRGAFLSSLADDRYGLYYAKEFETLGIDLVNPPAVGGMTGTAAVFVTPDSERTMRTCLSVSSNLNEQHVQEDTIALSEWLFIEGYILANSDAARAAARKAIAAAKKNGCKVAFTCSEAWLVQSFGDAVESVISQSDLVFMNETEACAYTGTASVEAAFKAMSARVPNVVVTGGARGAWIKWQGSELHVPAFPCTPRDLTGAGDMLAGAFLYGVTHGVGVEQSARGACYLAMQVITRVGARLHTGTKQFWDACMSGQV